MVSSIGGDKFRVIPRNRVICLADWCFVICLADGNLETGVYRKPTHTDKYLAFDSHHPIFHKKAVTKTLFMRAECLPSSSDSKAFERKYVIDVLKENNYPKDFLQNCLKPVLPSRKNH